MTLPDKENEHGIYEFGYTDYVIPIDSFIGKEIVVIKGRKYPIGTKAIIKGFEKWVKDGTFGRVYSEYVITNIGKINLDNVRLSKPRCWHHERIASVGNLQKECPNCKCEDWTYKYTCYESSSDYYVDVFRCKTCELLIKRY